MLLAVALVSSACQKSSAHSVTDGATAKEPALAPSHNDGSAALAQSRESAETQPVEAKPMAQAPEAAEAQPVEAKPAALTQANTPLLKELETLVRSSHYVAVLQDLSVEVSRADESDDLHRYKARVLETIRGPKLSEISYVMFTERGDTAGVNKEPVIVTLCRNEEGYYWPGPGSSFPNNAETRAVAREAAKQAPQGKQTFSNCPEIPK
jgi:hypothetical protein